MTDVLSIPTQSDRVSFFEPVHPLRRSPSSSSTSSLAASSTSSSTSSSQYTTFLTPNHAAFASSISEARPRNADAGCDAPSSISAPSSAPSSPRFTRSGFSNQPSYLSTPLSSLSLDEECSSDDEDIVFPSYDNGCSLKPDQVPAIGSTSLPSTRRNRPNVREPLIHDHSSVSKSYPKILDSPVKTQDDMAVRREPTKQIDYLSYDWTEEDVGSSWQYVVRRRKMYSYKDSLRLENATWRVWTIAKYRLETVSPSQVDWEKDKDITWLYGPLQTRAINSFEAASTLSASQLSRNNSFKSKKPILKRPSPSGLMLHQPPSSSTLVKQAIDALQAQHPDQRLRDRLMLHSRAMSDLDGSSLALPKDSAGTTPSTVLPSLSTSGAQTPCTKRHIHFNNKVEQCIAINKGGDDAGDSCGAIDDEQSSDDELLMMKPVHSAKAKLSNQSTPRNSFSNESKIIAMLPSTTLNCRGDTPANPQQMWKRKRSSWAGASKFSPSPSLEKLTPPTFSAKCILDDDDEDWDLDWQPAAIRHDGHERENVQSSFSSDLGMGSWRTPMGMFMSCENEDEGIGASGILGKVVDTVNSAKDIAHVIWNVGWRR